MARSPRRVISSFIAAFLSANGLIHAQVFDFSINPAASPLNANFDLSATTAGTLKGNYDPQTNPSGTRTKPGLFGSFGDTENVPVSLTFDPQVQDRLTTNTCGALRLSLDMTAGTVNLTNFAANLLAGGPVSVPASADVSFDTFRTRSPSSTYIGASTDFPLGDAIAHRLVVTQAEPVVQGTLTSLGAERYAFTLTPSVIFTARVEAQGADFDASSVPIPITITGEVAVAGDSATLTANTNLNINESIDTDQALPEFPLDLPTFLPPGSTAHVLLSLNLSNVSIGIVGTYGLSAAGSTTLRPPQWKGPAGGAYLADANWTNCVAPLGVDAVASFLGEAAADATIAVDEPITAGALVFDNPNRYTIAGTQPITLDVNAGQAKLQVSGGSHIVSAPLVLVDNTLIDVAAGSTLTLAAPLSSAAVGLTKQGAGAVQVRHIRAAGLTISDGTVQVLAGVGDAGTSRVSQIAITGAGRFDLADNDLVVQADEASRQQALAAVSGLVDRALNEGSSRWAGPGIGSGSAAANPLAGLAVVLNDNGAGGVLMSSFSGQEVDRNSILVKYTYNGDVDLSGKVDAADYFRVDSGFLAQLSGYANGDLDYSGRVDAADYFLIDSAFLGQGAPAAAAAVTVPEPQTMAVLALAACGLLCRRRG